MVEVSYFETSLAAFRQRFPHIADRIQDAPTDIDIEVVRADGRPIDVKIGSGSLYAGDGRQYADEQITQYMKRPIRFGIGSPKTAGLGSAVGLEMLDHIQARLRADGRKSIAELPVAAPQFLIIFGIGLGLHLERLIRETKAKWVLMVEPLPGLLHHSLSAIDWAELFAEADRNGIEINISCESSPESMVSWIQAHVIGYGVGFIDGSYTFIHYPLWSLKDARTRLFETIDHSFIARGFFEDELTMMTNTVGNLLENRGHMINGSPIRQRREPVFIVGSGPSIDTSIETIKKYRDRAIVISCGTGLRVLFRNGITPDFHTEMENGEWVYDTAMLSAQFGDLKKIILLTTTTVPQYYLKCNSRLNYYVL